LAKEILVRLTEIGIRLSHDVTLLNQPLYLHLESLLLGVGNQSGPGSYPDTMAPITIPPIINLTEEEKGIYSVGFIGKLFKQGHNVKSWKERLVLIAENKLQYFDLKMIYKGEFHVEDCQVELVINPSSANSTHNNNNNNLLDINHSSVASTITTNTMSFSFSPTAITTNSTNSSTLTNQSVSAPSNAFAFQLSNYATGGEFLICYVLSEYMRDLYHLILQTRNGHIQSIKALMQIPDMKTGWLLKQGHILRNWKKRFFVLNYGILTYYDDDNVANNKGVSETSKGKINLKNAQVTIVVADDSATTTTGGGKLTDIEQRICIQENNNNNNKLIVQMKNKDEKKEWFDALKRHVVYANEYLD
jgi:hypothetical protein